MEAWKQLLVQLAGATAVAAFALIVMGFAFFVIKVTMGLRVDKKVEIEGLDHEEHGLSSAYGDFVLSDYSDIINNDAVKGENSENAENTELAPLHLAVPVERAAGVLSKVEVIMKLERFESFKRAMNEIGVTGMTVSKVAGCGMQLVQSEYYRGSQMEINLLPKLKVEIVVAKVPVELVVNTARKVLYTGHIGDGKIFVYDVRNVVKVRTGEVDYEAMQGTTE